MADQSSTMARESDNLAPPDVERVVSILDFDESGMVTCQVTHPLANGFGSFRDSRSARSITTEEWREIRK
jgi:hypothetical protein